MGSYTSYSHNFLEDVRILYEHSLQDTVNKNGLRVGINCLTPHAGSAYILSVAAFESYINEAFFTSFNRPLPYYSKLSSLGSDWLEKLKILHKIKLISVLLFDKPFDTNNGTFQDFILLTRIRNDYVHFKMKDYCPKYIKPLEEREIAFPEHTPGKIDWSPYQKISTSEGIRWANNTVCKMATFLYKSVPSEFNMQSVALAKNFKSIKKRFAEDFFKSNQPEKLDHLGSVLTKVRKLS